MPSLYTIVKCWKCGRFVCKLARINFQDDTKVSIVCVCPNSRCRMDNLVFGSSNFIAATEHVRGSIYNCGD